MKGDKTVESGAAKLEALSDRAAAKGGIAGKLADELAGDASFLRQLKPSLIKARVKGEAPSGAEPTASTARRPTAPSGPQHVRQSGQKGKGANPFAVAFASFGAGTVLAKLIDWRSHAHPRR